MVGIFKGLQTSKLWMSAAGLAWAVIGWKMAAFRGKLVKAVKVAHRCRDFLSQGGWGILGCWERFLWMSWRACLRTVSRLWFSLTFYSTCIHIRRLAHRSLFLTHLSVRQKINDPSKSIQTLFFSFSATVSPNCITTKTLQKLIGIFINSPYSLTYILTSHCDKNWFAALLSCIWKTDLCKSLPPQLSINVNLFLCFDRNLGKSGLRVSCLGLGEITEKNPNLWTW